MNFADIPDSILSEKKDGELSLKERKIAERLVLEIYCQYDPSLPFREIIGPEVRFMFVNSSFLAVKLINFISSVISTRRTLRRIEMIFRFQYFDNNQTHNIVSV